MIPIDLNADLESILNKQFDGLHSGGGRSSIKGGQTEANRALELLDISGYAKNRSEVLPIGKRGATVLSPYIRHNLLTLDQVWKHVSRAPYQDQRNLEMNFSGKNMLGTYTHESELGYLKICVLSRLGMLRETGGQVV